MTTQNNPTRTTTWAQQVREHQTPQEASPIQPQYVFGGGRVVKQLDTRRQYDNPATP